MLLADMGADVIKVENPSGGDSMRAWPPLNQGYSENFASLNRNKRSIAIDLKNPAHRAIALDLCLDADIVVENNRPGVMDRNGLGYAFLSAHNPKLIYCSLSGFGQNGPRAQEGGFDVTIQAAAGVMSVTGEPGGTPVKCGVPISDFSTGLYAAYAICAALRDVERTGNGCHVDISLLGATLAVAALQTSEYFGTGQAPRKLGSAHPRNAPYQAFRAADKYFVMAAGNNKLWASVCEVVQRPDLITEPRFLNTSDRAANQDDLKNVLEEIFRARPAAEWLADFRRVGVPCAPINDYAEALADEQVEAMGWVQDISLPSGTVTRTFGSPVRFNGRARKIAFGPPTLGEHTDEIVAAIRAKAPAVS
jgi:crotonobetainyl-CoA:carnitine CoA-transferase CaiB-like acyl-CoA transferase